MSIDVTQHTMTSVREAIASGEMSAGELARVYLDRIDELDPTLHAYNQVFHDRAMSRARAVDAGEVTGPLAGVPIALKDNLATMYGRTTCSSKILQDFQAPYNATVVERLEDAGAVILGKTNLDEFAMGSSTENSAFGATCNPWDTDRVPGGSSGGSAAAMGADLCAAALGSDTGGSIRQPAAFCGIVGLKTTYGLVSRFGLVAFASSLDQIGPMTRNVEDAAALLNVIAGPDDRDSTCADTATRGGPVDYTDQLSTPVDRLRIGVARQYQGEGNHAAVTRMMDSAVDLFQSELGAEVVEVDLPHTEYGLPCYYIVAPAEASSNLARYDGVHYGHRSAAARDLIDLYAASRAEGFGEEVKRRIMLGTYALSSGYYDAYYLQALKVRRRILEDFQRAFGGEQGVDAIVCPTTPGPAFRMGEKCDDPLSMYLCDAYTVPASMAGITGVSLPAGLTEVEGRTLPLGLQLLGPTFSEAKLLRIARMAEQAGPADWRSPRPTPAPAAG